MRSGRPAASQPDHETLDHEVIILAAGDSTRLFPVTRKFPKCLLEIDGQNLLNRQIESFRSQGINRFTIVAGYQFEKILPITKKERLAIITNRIYERTGSLYSLWLSRRNYETGIIIINSDVYLLPELAAKIALPSSSNAALVDPLAEWDEESTKVKIEGERVTQWSRSLSSTESSGENLGIVRISREHVGEFFGTVDRLVSNGHQAEWWPEALNEFVKRNTVIAVSSCGILWKEIDTVQDYLELQKAIRMRTEA